MNGETNTCELVFHPTDASLRLSAAQRTALEVLSTGGTLVDAAHAAGVNRSTLYRWIDADPTFKTLWSDFQTQQARSAYARLLSLTDAAVDTVSRALETGDARTALTVLQRLGILTAKKTGGPVEGPR